MDLNKIKAYLKDFQKNGFVIVDAENKDFLVKSRHLLASSLRKRYKIEIDDDTLVLNNIHNLIDVSDLTANEIVLNTIKDYSSNLDMANCIFESNKSLLSAMLGPDIASQKHANIVFQFPHSQRYSELHCDAPPCSLHELVAWVPMVDCYDTKSFYLLDISNSKELMNRYENDDAISDWQDVRKIALNSCIHLKINFGQILYFSATLFHGSLINLTDESRWTLNTRFKNLFAPCGLKDPFTFYKVLHTSPITNLALNHLK